MNTSGFALNGKVYFNGVVPVSYYGATNTAFGKVSSSGEIVTDFLPTQSICDLIVPGVYSTDLYNLNFMDGFDSFMYNCFSGASSSVPVLIFVPSNVVRELDSSEAKKQLILLHYSQYCENRNQSYDRNTIYNALSGKPVPELGFVNMKHLSYKTYDPHVSADLTDISVGNIEVDDFIDNKIDYYIYYDNKPIKFEVLQPNVYITLYVGGYGFKVFYPDNYVFVRFDTGSKKYVLIRQYEAPYITNYSKMLSSYQRNNIFSPIKQDDGATVTLAWKKPDPSIYRYDNGGIVNTYENQSNIDVSLDMPYNPAIYTMLGQEPFNQKITLKSGFTSLDNIGIIHSGGKIQDRTLAYNIENYSASSPSDSKYCLPQGEYLLSDGSTIGNTPVNTGMYALNVFSAGNGSMIQQVLTDPSVAQYNKYTRSWSTSNSKYGGWSGSNII